VLMLGGSIVPEHRLPRCYARFRDSCFTGTVLSRDGPVASSQVTVCPVIVTGYAILTNTRTDAHVHGAPAPRPIAERTRKPPERPPAS
jgi:hypothetical protein